ncbi:hypothetical protein [Streptomyces spongiae]|uniref:Uncharacterized protein n=1 Tax=Streptomyces spongiae TaxID=565072 RepID=A0A5N8XP23_9ACTN|nr:hypothetical protein [Streptomyces spongiae]MPY61152.1 hypothetical protein [Streptomyces spongiae]
MSLKSILAAGAATSAATLSLIAMAPGATAAQGSPDAVANALTCTTFTPNGRKGVADCTNNTNRTIAFRVTVVCGRAMDQVGPWRTLNPGARDTSSINCPFLSTGVGSVNWQEG